MFWHIAFWYSLFFSFKGGKRVIVCNNLFYVYVHRMYYWMIKLLEVLLTIAISLLKVMIAIDEDIRKDGKKKEHIISF